MASDRGLDNSLLEQIRGATGGTGTRCRVFDLELRALLFSLVIEGPDPPDQPPDQAPDPFNDPPPPPFAGSSVNSLKEVEMTTFRSNITGGMP